jgi:hypothetical protein
MRALPGGASPFAVRAVVAAASRYPWAVDVYMLGAALAVYLERTSTPSEALHALCGAMTAPDPRARMDLRRARDTLHDILGAETF